MLALKIICILLGLALTSFGYLIFFKKKYFLINGFEEAYKAGRKNEEYALRVGKVELTIGIVLLVVAGILIVL